MSDDLFDSILDTNLSDIADLPEYLDFCPAGAYILDIVEAEHKKVEVDNPDKKVGGKIEADVLQVTYEISSIAELVDPSNEGLVKTKVKDGVGSRFNESFFFHKDPKKSQEIFKAKYKAIAEKLGFNSVGETLRGMKGVQILATVTSKKGKDRENERYFINTANIQVI